MYRAPEAPRLGQVAPAAVGRGELPQVPRVVEIGVVVVEERGQVHVAVARPHVGGDDPLAAQPAQREAQAGGAGDDFQLAVQVAFDLEDHAPHAVLHGVLLPVPARLVQGGQRDPLVPVGRAHVHVPGADDAAAAHPGRTVPAVLLVLPRIGGVEHQVAPLHPYSMQRHHDAPVRPGGVEEVDPHRPEESRRGHLARLVPAPRFGPEHVVGQQVGGDHPHVVPSRYHVARDVERVGGPDPRPDRARVDPQLGRLLHLAEVQDHLPAGGVRQLHFLVVLGEPAVPPQPLVDPGARLDLPRPAAELERARDAVLVRRRAALDRQHARLPFPMGDVEPARSPCRYVPSPPAAGCRRRTARIGS